MTGDRRWAAFEARRKSQTVAYLLWLFLGLAGAHRFYLGMKVSGSLMLCLSCIVGATLFLGDFSEEALLPVILIATLLAVWVLPDVFRISGFVRAYNDSLIRWLGGDVETYWRPGTRQGRYRQGGRDRESGRGAPWGARRRRPRPRQRNG